MIIFNIRLTPMPGCTDPIKSLRWTLKSLARRHGLRAISAVEEISEIPAQQDRAGRSRQTPGPKDPSTP